MDKITLEKQKVKNLIYPFSEVYIDSKTRKYYILMEVELVKIPKQKGKNTFISK